MIATKWILFYFVSITHLEITDQGAFDRHFNTKEECIAASKSLRYTLEEKYERNKLLAGGHDASLTFVCVRTDGKF